MMMMNIFVFRFYTGLRMNLIFHCNPYQPYKPKYGHTNAVPGNFHTHE